jgi:cell division protein FtsI (penicillin-binding protein 3)
MIYGVATLLNSGQRVAPWFLNGLYDYTEERFFLRDFTVSPRERILSPVQGIQLRREILGNSFSSDEGGFLFADAASTVSQQNGLSVHHTQDLLLAAVPREQPDVLLLLTVDYGTLAPHPPEVESRDLEGLLGLGRNLLPILVGYGGPVETFAEPSPEKNSANLRRYFFSRKLSAAEVQENLVHTEPIMPSLIGLSLRKGLQQINRYNIKVRIQGSGRIVDQNPAAGEPLSETEICELILETEHD